MYTLVETDRKDVIPLQMRAKAFEFLAPVHENKISKDLLPYIMVPEVQERGPSTAPKVNVD